MTCCRAHGSLLNVMWQTGWEGVLGENGYMCAYGWLSPCPCSPETITTLLINWSPAEYEIKSSKGEKKGTWCIIAAAAAAAAKSLQSCLTLCDPRDGSLPGSSVPGILQARTPEWVAISFSNAWEWKVKGKLLSSVRLRDPMDCSPPGSSIHGIFQARILEWGAIAACLIIKP